MPVIHDTIPQFFNGVSQQAPNLRRVSQVEEQINCVSSISEGVLPRPPSEHLAQVSATVLGNAFVHTINRDVEERFQVIIKDGSIDVYRLSDGVPMTVSYPAGTGYLSVSDAKAQFEAYTVKDYTFILNKSVVTAKTTITAGSLDGTVQQFSNLKDEFPDEAAGTFYKIEGDADSSFDSYYVEKTQNNAGTDGDVYTEVVDPTTTAITFDDSTMPHQLVRTGATSFELQVIPWVSKAAGDDTTNPFPSFTESTISDLLIFRNRFGFLSGDNVILSEAGAANFFNFFRTTVTQLLDSDPIDVSANNTRVADLKFAVPFAESLLLFSDQTQFELGTDDLLTPTTVEIQPTTNFVTSTKARPVLAGRNVYFTMERSEYSGLREYFVDGDSRGNDAADVTKHVPRYLPKDIFKIVPSSNDDTLFILSERETNIIYIYQWYWAQTEGGLNKLQSAWHKWDFGAGVNILNIDLIDNNLYMLLERDSKTFLEVIDLATRKYDTDLPYQIRLDRRGSYTGVYDGMAQATTWTIPYTTSDTIVVVRDGGFVENGGLEVLNTTQPTTTTITAPGNYSESNCIIGFAYRKELTPSPIYKRTPSGNGGSIARLGGSLKLRKIKFAYSDSSFFSVEVTPKDRPTVSRDFSAPIGSNDALIGANSPRDGVFSVPVVSEASTTKISITSNSYLPFAITSAEWEGFFHSNAR